MDRVNICVLLRKKEEKMTLNEKQSKKDLLIQFVKFGIVGVMNTAITLAIYYIFIWFNEDLYQIGNAVGWMVSVLNAFYFGNRVVFKQKNNSRKDLLRRLLKSYITYGSTFLLTVILLKLEVQVYGISEYIAPIINLLITIPLNFLINKYWTFKEK